MNKNVKWGVYILIIAGLGGLGAYRFLPKTKQEATSPARQSQERRVLSVDAVVIAEQNLIDDQDYVGRLLPDEEVDLSFQTSGMVTHIVFQEGTHVRKGQLLAKVNDAPLLAQLMKLEAQLKLAQDRVYRQSTLLEKDAVSKEAYEQVKTDLESLHADIQLVKANIDLTELKAPFDGIIGLRQVSEGAYASPTTVIAKLTRISPIKIEFSISERYAGRIGAGTPISFSLEGDRNIYSGNIYAVESTIERTTSTFAARALHPNLNGALRPGRTASVKVRMLDISNAIAIPTEAIVPEMGVDKVFLYRAGKAQPVAVTKGLRSESLIQVTDGLNFGDTIIVSGTLQLRTGLDVTLNAIN